MVKTKVGVLAWKPHWPKVLTSVLSFGMLHVIVVSLYVCLPTPLGAP